MLLKYYHFNYLIQSFLDHAKGGGGRGWCNPTKNQAQPGLFQGGDWVFLGFFGIFWVFLGFLNFSDFLLYTQPCTCENVFTCVMGKCRTKHEIQTFKKKLEEHDIIPILGQFKNIRLDNLVT